MQCRILLVSAEPGVHDRLGGALAVAGHVVDGERDGTAALRSLRRHRYDAVVLDYQLPGMSGLALARAMRDLCLASGASTSLVALARSPDDLVVRRGPGALFAARILLDDPVKDLLSAIERSASLGAGVEALAGMSTARAREASRAIWASRGHLGLPRVLVVPEPFPHQRDTLDLCFDLSRPDLAECVLLLERHGARQIPSWADRLPVIALSQDAADIADAVFAIEDEDSWDLVVALIADAAPANTAR